MATAHTHKMVCIDKEVVAVIVGQSLGVESVNSTLRRMLGLPPREDMRKYNGSYKRMKKGKKK